MVLRSSGGLGVTLGELPVSVVGRLFMNDVSIPIRWQQGWNRSLGILDVSGPVGSLTIIA